MSQDIFQKLKKPFNPKDLEFRLGRTTQDKSKGLVFTYVTARAIQERLDDVVGATEWTNSVKIEEQGVVANLSIRVGGEWVAKSDGASYTNVESFKGGISDAFKRVAVMFGIGRYLYTLPQTWVDLENGRISKSSITKLRKEMEHFSGSYTRVKNTPKVTDGMTPKQKHYSGKEGMPLDDIAIVNPSDLPPVPTEKEVISFGNDDVKKKVAENVAKVKGKIDYDKPHKVDATKVYGVRSTLEDMGATEVTLESTVFGKASPAQQKMVKFCADKIRKVDPTFNLLAITMEHKAVKPMVEEVIGIGRELEVWD